MKRKKNILCPLRSTRLESAKGLLLCYAVCVILFLGFKLCAGLWVFYGFQNGRYAQRNLTLNDFEQYGVEQLDEYDDGKRHGRYTALDYREYI